MPATNMTEQDYPFIYISSENSGKVRLATNTEMRHDYTMLKTLENFFEPFFASVSTGANEQNPPPCIRGDEQPL